MPAQNLQTYCPSDVKTAFYASAYAQGCAASALLRRLILEHLQREGRADVLAAAAAPPMERRSHRLTLTLTPTEFAFIAAHAAPFGTVGEWLVGLVRSRIRKSIPLLARTELEALLASNRELWAIGRNLNQIARVLNEDVKLTGRAQHAGPSNEQFGELAQKLDMHTRQVVAICNASSRRWGAHER